ncbi:MAG: hypothetical protein AABX70_04005 [Nanoarchaeota archaeon]
MFREEQFTHTFQQKGWTKREIQEAVSILKKAEEKKHPIHKFVENNLLGVALLKAFIANLFATTVAIPFILFFQGRTLYVFLAVLGLSFGIILHSVLKQVENLETKQHTLAFFFLALTILIKFRIGVHLAQLFAQSLQLIPVQDPWTLTFSYLLPYLCPYVYLLMEEKKWI